MQSKIYHLHTLSPLHCGIGQTVGVVDLPIARARATHLPIAPGSSVRGVLRNQLEACCERTVTQHLFGPRNISTAEEARAGALSISDAQLLVLPVRSLAGILCYATSPFILKRYRQDLSRAGHAPPAVPTGPNNDQAKVVAGSVNRIDNTLVLEDLDLQAAEDPALKPWAEQIAAGIHSHDPEAQQDMIQRFALLPDHIFSFLAETATEIRTRIAIDPKTGTVKSGALWYEENLPAETLFWGVYALAPEQPATPEIVTQIAEASAGGEFTLQLGGDAGVGRGLVRLLDLKVEAPHA